MPFSLGLRWFRILIILQADPQTHLFLFYTLSFVFLLIPESDILLDAVIYYCPRLKVTTITNNGDAHSSKTYRARKCLTAESSGDEDDDDDEEEEEEEEPKADKLDPATQP